MIEPFTVLSSRTVVLPVDNIDTDQIIPARFLTTTQRDGLGRHLFADWRRDAANRPREDFVLNRPGAEGARILVAGRNFGCGSSREHAPWALLDYGFRAVISTEIADIFRSNALRNGLLPVVIDADSHAWLLAHPGAEIGIDLRDCTVRMAAGREAGFEVEPFARHCLLNGIDPLGWLLSQVPAIQAYEDRAACRA
ncbi:3-isopropylmalate dehydratase small subunit [Thioalkalivibrio sp. XN8]|uniref:3-isopropylmalate dehydratase small subunit n=1 Tax=Thioalkalivibrio sp. XN8 TaxID=2712863 RepID=UPI00197EB287|nr:3-isopropylmalate dehydratase small subunit [Thioalkalivibrio sp. XN8]